jgi:hypothetical protein
MESSKNVVALLTLPRWAEKYITVMAMQNSTSNDVCASAIILAGIESAYDELGLPFDCKLEDLWEGLRDAAK